jgi:glutamine synthetase
MMLNAGLDGVKNNLTPPAEVRRDIFKMTAAEMEECGIATLPANLKEAIGEFKANPLSKETLGAHIFEKYVEAKDKEWDRFRTAVTDWELNEYLTVY